MQLVVFMCRRIPIGSPNILQYYTQFHYIVSQVVHQKLVWVKYGPIADAIVKRYPSACYSLAERPESTNSPF